MEYPRYIQLLVKRWTGNLSAEEERELERWGQQPGRRQSADETKRLWDLTGRYRAGYQPDTEKGLERLQRRMNETSPGSKPHAYLTWLLWVVALVMIALALFLTFRQRPWAGPRGPVAVATGPGEHRSLTLPDGSVAVLNENSRLSFESDWAGDSVHRVQLAGEAFFQVEPAEGLPFVVVTADTETRVLGTAFNLRAYSEETDTELTVEEGTVAFGMRGTPTQRLILQAGEKAICFRDLRSLVREENAGLNARAWQTGVLRFRRTPVQEVVRSLQHYFSIRLDFKEPAIADCQVNQEPFREEDLSDVLPALALSIGARLEKLDDHHYVLHGGNCR